MVQYCGRVEDRLSTATVALPTIPSFLRESLCTPLYRAWELVIDFVILRRFKFLVSWIVRVVINHLLTALHAILMRGCWASGHKLDLYTRVMRAVSLEV